MTNFENHIFLFTEKNKYDDASNNARVIIGKMINNEKVSEGDLLGIFDVWYCRYTGDQLLSRDATFDESGGQLIFNISGQRNKQPIKSSEFKKASIKCFDSVRSDAIDPNDYSFAELRHKLRIDTDSIFCGSVDKLDKIVSDSETKKRVLFCFKYLQKQNFFCGLVECEQVEKNLETNRLDVVAKRSELMFSTKEIIGGRIVDFGNANDSVKFWRFSEMKPDGLQSISISITDEQFSLYDLKNLIILFEEYKNTVFFLTLDFLNEKDIYRFIPYLYFINSRVSNTVLLIKNQLNRNYEMLINNKDEIFGELMPIVTIEKEDYLVLKNKHEMINIYDGMIEANLIENIKRYRTRENNRNTRESSKPFIKANLAKLCQINFDSQIRLDELYKKVIISNIFDFFENAYLSKYEVDFTNLLKKVLISIKHSDLMMSTIFAILLNSIDIGKKDGERDIKNIERSIEKCAIDAHSYAAGIEELVENAIFHTTRKVFLWFRLHETGAGASEDSIISCAEKRKILNEKYYYYDSYKSDNKKVESKTRYYVEFEIFDAVKPSDNIYGIKKQFENILNKGKAVAETVKFAGFFNDEELTEGHEKFLREHPTRHYGIRTFAKVIKNNGGQFLVKSVCSEYRIDERLIFERINARNNKLQFSRRIVNNGISSGDIAYATNNVKHNPRFDSHFLGTVYSILLPGASLQQDDSGIAKSQTIFEQNNIDKIFSVVEIETKNIKNELLKAISFDDMMTQVSRNRIQQEKEKLVSNVAREIHDSLDKTLNEYDQKLSINVVSISADEVLNYIEYLAKALIQVLVCDGNKGVVEYSNYYVLNFNADKNGLASHRCIIEFVRFFQICYLKGEQPALANIQIALASNNEIKFMLVGKDLATLYATAKSFAYYNFANTKDYIADLKSIIGYSDGCIDIPPIFPFELYLKNGVNELFLNDEMKVLESPLQDSSYGVRLYDMNFRLSERIHAKSYYETDLIFNNIAHINKIAYIIARNIIFDLNKKEKQNNVNMSKLKHLVNNGVKNFVIVGYRQYTEILVSYIQDIIGTYLNQTDDAEIRNLRVSSGMVLFDDKKQEYFRSPFKYSDKETKQIENSVYVLIMPISATMSAFDKMQELIEKYSTKVNSKIKIKVINRTCVFLPKAQKGLIFYRDVKIDTKLEPYMKKVVRIEDKNNSEIFYVFRVENTFYDELNDFPKDDRLKTFFVNDKAVNEKLLVKIDKVTSKPERIFELYSKHQTQEILNDAEISKINKLHGCIDYAHITRNENHYKFYLDTERYFEESKEEIEKWLESYVVTKMRKVDDNFVFNILVAPQHQSNSSFIKMVAKKLFQHNIKFVYFSLENSFKEDAKARYSYITEDIREIIDKFYQATVNIYYIDDVLNNGKNFIRSKSLIQMLINEAGIANKNITVNTFEGIILLVNRCSENRIYQFLDDKNSKAEEAKSRFFCFLNLNAPVLKTSSFKCPSCNLVDTYTLMSKRAATSELSNEWARLAKKHRSISHFEYSGELRKSVSEISRKNYYYWYKQWIYTNIYLPSKTRVKDEKVRFVSEFEKHFALINKYDAAIYEDKFDEDKWDDIIVDCVINNVIADRNFRRLSALNDCNNYLRDLFSKMDCEHDDFNEKALFETRRSILCILAKFGISDKELERINKKHKGTIESNYVLQELLINKAENLISYIKVLSRPLISTYYHVGQAIMTIMLELLESFISGNQVVINREYEACQWYKEYVCIKENRDNVMQYEENLKSILRVVRAEFGSKTKDERDYFVPILTQFQFVYTLIKRLSDLGSEYLYRNFKNKKNINDLWKELLERFEKLDNELIYKKMHGNIVRKESMVFVSNYVRLTKWASLIRDEESSGRIINEGVMIVENGLETSDKTSEQIDEQLYIENSRNIYSYIMGDLETKNPEKTGFYKMMELDYRNEFTDKLDETFSEYSKYIDQNLKEFAKSLSEFAEKSTDAIKDDDEKEKFLSRLTAAMGNTNRNIVGACVFMKTKLSDENETVRVVNTCFKSNASDIEKSRLQEDFLYYNIKNTNWILDTYKICENDNRQITGVLIRIPYHGIDDETKYIYMYLSFYNKKIIQKRQALFCLRNILFLRSSIENSFRKIGSYFSGKITNVRHTVDIVKEIYRCVTQEGRNHYSLLGNCSSIDALKTALEYAKSLFKELQDKHQWFGYKIAGLNFIIGEKSEYGISVNGETKLTSIDFDKNMTRQISERLTKFMSDYYLKWEYQKDYDDSKGTWNTFSEMLHKKVREQIESKYFIFDDSALKGYSQSDIYIYFSSIHMDELYAICSDVRRNAKISEDSKIIICIEPDINGIKISISNVIKDTSKETPYQIAKRKNEEKRNRMPILVLERMRNETNYNNESFKNPTFMADPIDSDNRLLSIIYANLVHDIIYKK